MQCLTLQNSIQYKIENSIVQFSECFIVILFKTFQCFQALIMLFFIFLIIYM